MIFLRIGIVISVFIIAISAIVLFFEQPNIIAETAGLETSGLFTSIDVNGDRYPDVFDDPTSIRSRWVNLNWDVLEVAGGLQGAELVLNLFEDVVFIVVIDSYKSGGAGKYVITGHVKNVNYSQVILVVEDSVMSGNITLPGFFYQVRYIDGDIHVIRRIDHSAFPPEAEPIPVEPFGADMQQFSADAMADDGSIIDILVVYTEAAKNSAGGTTAMNTLINLAVEETNQSYDNSSVSQRLRLVHKAEVVYDETDFDWDDALSRLRGTSDGYIDNVHNLRDRYGADCVVFIVNDSTWCGKAYMMSFVSSTFQSWAYSLVNRGCATGYYSFGHELGHNMGARHDWYVDSTNNSPYTYNHAYVNVEDRWRTIMGYNTECSAETVYCTRLQYWSNPDVDYNGDPSDPMGVAEGQPNAADNRKTLNNTAYTVANFREAIRHVNPGVLLLLLGGS